MLKLFTVLCLFYSSFTFAKDYHVKLQVKNLPTKEKPVLLRIYNGNMFIIDSIPTVENGTITFKIPANTPSGMLRSVLGIGADSYTGRPNPVAINFVFNKEDIVLNVDFNAPEKSIEIIESQENQIYFDFLKADELFRQKLGLLEQVVISYPDKDEFYEKALDFYEEVQHNRNKHIDKTYKSNPASVAGRIIRNQKIPFATGNLSAEERDSIFKQDFLAEVDFNDTTLLFTSVYTDKIYQYLMMFMKREAQPRENEANAIKALDHIVPLLDVNPSIQQHILQFLIEAFESMKMEEVLAHISTNYSQQCGGDTDIVKRRLEGYRRMAVGQKVQDFTVNTPDGTPVNLYSQMNPYTLIIFWHTTCGHCKAIIDQLPALAEKGLFNEHQVKIIGVSIDDNKEDWEKFSATYKLDWSNTHIEDGYENPIAEGYNLFATPSIFLIDSEQKIVAKPLTIVELEKTISEL